jgi:hypothetical protein
VGRLGGKGRTVGWKGRGVVCGKPTPSRLQPPPVSVKNRWVGPREQVLNVLIACWWYGPSKLMQQCTHLVETSLPYSRAVVREDK